MRGSIIRFIKHYNIFSMHAAMLGQRRQMAPYIPGKNGPRANRELKRPRISNYSQNWKCKPLQSKICNTTNVLFSQFHPPRG